MRRPLSACSIGENNPGHKGGLTYDCHFSTSAGPDYGLAGTRAPAGHGGVPRPLAGRTDLPDRGHRARLCRQPAADSDPVPAGDRVRGRDRGHPGARADPFRPHRRAALPRCSRCRQANRGQARRPGGNGRRGRVDLPGHRRPRGTRMAGIDGAPHHQPESAAVRDTVHRAVPDRHRRLGDGGAAAPGRRAGGRSGLSPDEPGLVGQDHRLHSVPQVQLGQDVAHVSLDGAFLDDKPSGDLGVRQALGNQPEHVELPAGQLAKDRGNCSRGPDGAGEAADETPGGERVDKRASSGDGTNRPDELRLRRVLEEEPARPALQRPVDVLVVVEGGQHQHAGGLGRLEDPPGRFQAVQHGHPDIHQHYTGTKARDDADRLQPVRRLADHAHSRFMVEDDADAVADKALVICDHDRDQVCLGHRSERTVKGVSAGEPGVLPSAGRAWVAAGIVLAAGLSAFAAVLVLGFTHTGHHHGGVAAAAGVLAMTVPVAWAYRAPTLTLAILLAAAMLNGLVLGSMVRCGGTLPALLYATACAGARPWSRRTALCIVLALMAAVAQAFSDPNLGPGFLIFGVPAVLAFCLVGRLAGQHLEAIADLRRRNADLAAQRERTAALSVMVERERVTGDLDALLRLNLDRISAAARDGHNATDSADGPADPELARAAFTEIEECGRDSLSMIRALIQDLRHQTAAGP